MVDCRFSNLLPSVLTSLSSFRLVSSVLDMSTWNSKKNCNSTHSKLDGYYLFLNPISSLITFLAIQSRNRGVIINSSFSHPFPNSVLDFPPNSAAFTSFFFFCYCSGYLLFSIHIITVLVNVLNIFP